MIEVLLCCGVCSIDSYAGLVGSSPRMEEVVRGR